MKWNGIKNGMLLQLLKENNFKCWIVVDKNIPYQQNISTLPCLIIVLDVMRNTLQHLTPLLPSVIKILEDFTENKVVIVTEAIL